MGLVELTAKQIEDEHENEDEDEPRHKLSQRATNRVKLHEFEKRTAACDELRPSGISIRELQNVEVWIRCAPTIPYLI
jgi:hypothetical protein